MDRRRFLGVLGLAVAEATLVACGGQTPPTPVRPRPIETPKPAAPATRIATATPQKAPAPETPKLTPIQEVPESVIRTYDTLTEDQKRQEGELWDNIYRTWAEPINTANPAETADKRIGAIATALERTLNAGLKPANGYKNKHNIRIVPVENLRDVEGVPVIAARGTRYEVANNAFIPLVLVSRAGVLSGEYTDPLLTTSVIAARITVVGKIMEHPSMSQAKTAGEMQYQFALLERNQSEMVSISNEGEAVIARAFLGHLAASGKKTIDSPRQRRLLTTTLAFLKCNQESNACFSQEIRGPQPVIPAPTVPRGLIS